MFGTIRKHQSWLWFIIIGLMAVSMLVWQNNLGKNGNQPGATGSFGSIDGKAITASETLKARNETLLMFLMRNHEWPDSPGADPNFNLDRETDQRLFLIRKLDEYNIHADSDSVAKLAGLYLRQFGNGQTASLEAFVDQILKTHGIGAEDFQRFAEHNLSIQQLAAVVGVSGKLVTPAEIRSLYVQEYQELKVEAAFFSASNYLAKITEPAPEALAQFYTNQEASYREPDQMQLSYVFFNVTNFMPAAEKQIGTNIDREAEEALARLGTNGLRYGKTPEEAKTKIRELITQEVAISNAYTKAVDFQNALVAKQPLNVDSLGALAKEKGLEAKVTKPFDKEYGPGELNLGPSYPMAALFNLTSDTPLVDRPIRGADGVYVLQYNQLIPSHIPPLAEIHNRVMSDYKFVQAMRLAQMNAHVFAQTATNELAHGKTFAEVCAATKVNPVTLAPFSLSTESLPEVEDHADVNSFKEVAFSTPVGEASKFTMTRDGGFVVHVSKRLPVDQTKMNSQLPEFSNLVRQRRQNEAFELWFNREASAALHDLPAFQTRQEATGLGH